MQKHLKHRFSDFHFYARIGFPGPTRRIRGTKIIGSRLFYVKLTPLIYTKRLFSMQKNLVTITPFEVFLHLRCYIRFICIGNKIERYLLSKWQQGRNTWGGGLGGLSPVTPPPPPQYFAFTILFKTPD